MNWAAGYLVKRAMLKTAETDFANMPSLSIGGGGNRNPAGKIGFGGIGMTPGGGGGGIGDGMGGGGAGGGFLGRNPMQQSAWKGFGTELRNTGLMLGAFRGLSAWGNRAAFGGGLKGMAKAFVPYADKIFKPVAATAEAASKIVPAATEAAAAGSKAIPAATNVASKAIPTAAEAAGFAAKGVKPAASALEAASGAAPGALNRAAAPVAEAGAKLLPTAGGIVSKVVPAAARQAVGGVAKGVMGPAGWIPLAAEGGAAAAEDWTKSLDTIEQNQRMGEVRGTQMAMRQNMIRTMAGDYGDDRKMKMMEDMKRQGKQIPQWMLDQKMNPMKKTFHNTPKPMMLPGRR
jgi:hypothetical protein